MKFWNRRRAAALICAAMSSGTSLNIVLITRPVRAAPAQEAPAAKQKPLEAVLAAMSRTAGVTLLADSTVAKEQVTPPAEPTTPLNYEAQVTALLATLPKGSTWARLYLPAPAKGKWSGDAVAEYALAQARLFGNVGGATAPGAIEILGKQVGADKAPAYIKDLNLETVCVVSNPRARTTNAFGFTGDPAQWANLSPEERRAQAAQAAQGLLNMDPAARGQLMQQNMLVFGEMMRQLTPEQRQQMFQSMGVNGDVRIQTLPGGGSREERILIRP